MRIPKRLITNAKRVNHSLNKKKIMKQSKTRFVRTIFVLFLTLLVTGVYGQEVVGELMRAKYTYVGKNFQQKIDSLIKVYALPKQKPYTQWQNNTWKEKYKNEDVEFLSIFHVVQKPKVKSNPDTTRYIFSITGIPELEIGLLEFFIERP